MHKLLVNAREVAQPPVAPTLEEIRHWPATVPVAQACPVFGISRSYAYELVAQDKFPARVIKMGRRVVVVTASLVAALEAAA